MERYSAEQIEDIATMIVATQEETRQAVKYEIAGEKKVPMVDAFYGLAVPLDVREKVSGLRFSGVEALAEKTISNKW